jgi:hypothetical protein
MLPHLLLFVLLTPVCLLTNILLYFSKRGEVLLIIAEKKQTINNKDSNGKN